MSDKPSQRSPRPPLPDKPKSGTTRRVFLKSAGAISAGAAGFEVLHGVSIAEETRQAQVAGPGKIPLKLHINGQVHSVSVEPRTTLAETLRDELHLIGTKVVCDRGACSACTVMLGKASVCSCMTLAVDVGERKITTVEGLAVGDKLHPVQAAFIAHDALQCGFCTSGMVMSCAALLERNRNPQLEDVKSAISGNICRCGTYPKVFEAALATSENRGT
jgi:xanthine dehydrogenase YagT iron-sulfur-binding subunit